MAEQSMLMTQPANALTLPTSFPSLVASSDVDTLPLAVADPLTRQASEIDPTNGHVLLFGCGQYGLMPDIGDDEHHVAVPTASPFLTHHDALITNISFGAVHCLLTTEHGTVVAFGDNSNGQCAQPRNEHTNIVTPTQLNALDSKFITYTAAGYAHSAVITSAGELLMFGDNSCGQLGVNTAQTPIYQWDFDQHSTPVLCKEMKNIAKVVKVACGDYHTLALTEQGVLYACGDASRGATGLQEGKYWHSKPGESSVLGTRVAVFREISDLTPIPIIDIAAGNNHSLALTATGQVYAFGAGKRGQTGVGSSTPTLTPRLIDSLNGKRIVKIAAGAEQSAFLDSEGNLYMCGANAHGQLGLGDTDHRFVPLRVDLANVVAVAVGSTHTLAATADHQLYGWGQASEGQLATTNTLRRRMSIDDGDESSVDSATNAELFAADRLRPTPIRSPNFDGRRIVTLAAGSDTSAVVVAPNLSTTLSPPTFPPPLTSYGIIAFNWNTFSQLLERARAIHNYDKLDAYIRRVFSSPGALNASFLPYQQQTSGTALPSLSTAAINRTSSFLEKHGSNINSPTVQPSLHPSEPVPSLLPSATFPSPKHQHASKPCHSSIDGDSLENVYKAILSESVSEPKLAVSLAHSIQRSMTLMVQRVKTLHPPQNAIAYRCLCMALQSPHLSAGGQAEIAVIADIASVLKRMPVAARRQLVEWLSTYNPTIFAARMVRMTTRAITRRLADERGGERRPKIRNVSEEVILMVEMLSLMRQASEEAGKMVQDSHFYVDVESYIDLAYDFVTFIQVPPTASQLPPFAFCHYPFMLTPPTKALLLRFEHDHNQRVHLRNSLLSEQQPYTLLKIKRDAIVESAVYQLNQYSATELQRPLHVEFIGEPGIDQGGVKTEFFRLAIRELISTHYNLFDYSSEYRTLFYNKYNATDPSKLSLFYLSGQLLALAVYNGVSVHVSFPQCIYKQLLGLPLNLMDLTTVDPRLGTSLQQLLAYDQGDDEDVFGLSFSLNVEMKKYVKMAPSTNGTAGEVEEVTETTIETVDLIPNGTNIPVTAANKLDYVNLLVDYYLNKSIATQSQYFLNGFKEICMGRAMKLFTPRDLELIIVGQPSLNFQQLQATCRYEGGYHPQHPTIIDFWNVVLNELSNEERMDLLVFTTGSSRSPIGGLSDLRLVVQRAGPDTESVPTASTCFHTLLLPEYSTKEKLVAKLRIALANSEGFGLQ